MTPNKPNTKNMLWSSTSIAFVLSAALTFTAVPTAAAQETVAEDEESIQDTIIVTSRKRAESIQDVPLAITAFSEEQIRQRNLSQLEDVALQTPGLTFEDFSNGGYGAPVIRGASQLRVDQLEQNVSIFYDGIYIPRQYAFDLGMTNVSRIEVVKGPQSALYGANSFAGAINYVSKERNLNELTGTLSAGAGSDGLIKANGYVNIPIVQDVFAVSVSGAVSEFDGEFDNAYPGAANAPTKGTDDSIGGWDKDTFAIGATFKNGPFSAELDYSTFDALNEDGPHYRFNRTIASDFNCAFGPITFAAPGNRAICGEIPSKPTAGSSGIEGLLIDPRAFFEVSTDIVRGELQYDATDNISLTYLFGKVESEVYSLGESSRDSYAGTSNFAGSGNVFTYGPVGDVDYKTHEIRADIKITENINAMFGAFFMDGTDTDRFAGGFAPLNDLAPITEPLTPLANDNTTQTETKTSSLFGSIEFPLIGDLLTVSLEGRYSDVEKVTDGLVYSNESFTPRISADMNLTENNLLYASAAQGEKSGGINSSSVALDADELYYDEDTNTTYEIGSKNVLLDGRATLNAAVYYIAWDNLQATVSPRNAGAFTSGIVSNFGAATSKGLEIDGTFAVTENLVLNGGFSYVDATYDDGTTSERFGRICDGIVCDVVTDAASPLFGDGIIGGNTLARVPETQWTIGAQYDGQIGTEYDYFLRADVSGQAEQFAEEANLATLPSRTLTNLRGGISRGAVSADIWVTNLFDEEYISNAFFFTFAFGTEYVPTYGAGQRWGVSLTYDF